MTQLTEADYEIDMAALMAGIGIDPGTVAPDTAKLAFLDGKAVLTYTAMRAIPPILLAAALLRSHGPTDDPDLPVADEQEPPRPKVRARTTKKTTGRRAAK